MKNEIDGYIENFSPEVQKKLRQLRETILKHATGATERIAYGMPTYTGKKNLVHFAAFKNHIGFYPAPSGLQKFEKEIAKYKHSKGAVQFSLTEPLPLKLVETIVKFRVQEDIENTKQ